MNQSKRKANNCSRRQARENRGRRCCQRIKFVFDWSEMWCDIFQPSIKCSSAEPSWHSIEYLVDKLAMKTLLFLLSGQTCLVFEVKNCFPWSRVPILALKSHLSVVRLLQMGTIEWKASFERKCGTASVGLWNGKTLLVLRDRYCQSLYKIASNSLEGNVGSVQLFLFCQNKNNYVDWSKKPEPSLRKR